MLRIVLFLILILLAGLGFAWLAEQPGGLTLTLGGYQYQLTLAVAAIFIIAILAALLVLWWVIHAIWTTPSAVSSYFRTRRRDRGYKALSAGLIAAGAGDGGLAKRMGKQASKSISSDQEPLIHLLDAQSALLQGDHEAAQAKFSAMAKNPHTRLVGLRGLYLEAERLGKREVARHYANEAAEAAPQLNWATDAALEAKTEDHDWKGALALVDAQKTKSGADREAHARRRAVLLTGQAMDHLDNDPATARSAALEAIKLQPDFVPAAIVAADALFRQNDLRRGSKILESIWKKEPHPEVAERYTHARPGDSTHDRLARAKKLQRLRPNNVESELAVARAALDAGEFEEARAAAEAAIRISPREGAFLLLADIEEAQTGDQGRVRHWLAKAVQAPRDPAWVADGYVSEHWMPASPVTGQLDAFEWRAPVERLGQVIEGEEALDTVPAIAARDEYEGKEAPDSTTVIDAEPADHEEPEEKQQETEPQEEKKEEESTRDEKLLASEDTDAPTTPEQEPQEAAGTANGEAIKARDDDQAEKSEENRPPLPDDPGTDEEENEKPNGAGRFRLI